MFSLSVRFQNSKNKNYTVKSKIIVKSNYIYITIRRWVTGFISMVIILIVVAGSNDQQQSRNCSLLLLMKNVVVFLRLTREQYRRFRVRIHFTSMS